jgi:GNAT superfamily N-acetyltransferase
VLLERATPEALEADRADLRALIRDAVESGASIGFLLPLEDAVLDGYLDGIVADVEGESRIVLVARDGDGVIGSVQLGLADRPNSLHRAEVQKLLVHRSARNRGLGTRLMHEIEAIALSEGRTLLVLDTLAGSDAERLYTRLGWVESGRIPKYAGWPDGKLDPTVVFFKLLVRPRRNRELEDELARMAEDDQRVRQPPPADVLERRPSDEELMEMTRVDLANTERLEEIVDEHGWPGRSLVGKKGAHNAWLLAQHAHYRLDFQRRVLVLLEQAVAAGEASAADLAYLTDRVRMHEGRPQLYGTQLVGVEGGTPVPWAVEDPDGLDTRRTEAGLEPWGDYVARWGVDGSG